MIDHIRENIADNLKRIDAGEAARITFWYTGSDDEIRELLESFREDWWVVVRRVKADPSTAGLSFSRKDLYKCGERIHFAIPQAEATVDSK